MKKVYRYEDSLGDIVNEDVPTVFLAGPTVRGNQPHLVSWRFEAIAEFERQQFEGSLIVPEFVDRTMSDKDKLWIPAWEFAGLCASDVNMFWVPRTKELIGLTTNHEKGYGLARNRNKVVYGRPDDSYRNIYLDIMWDMDFTQNGPMYGERPLIHNNLSDTVTFSIMQARKQQGNNRCMSKVGVRSPYGVF